MCSAAHPKFRRSPVQLGIRNDEAGQKAREAGLIYVQDKCIKVEHARFLGA